VSTAAEPINFETLPALTIVAKGEVVSSNVAAFRAKVKEWLSALNLEPKTDEEFGQAQLDIKGMKSAEDAIKAAHEATLAQAGTILAELKEMADGGEKIRQARLTLEKAVTTQTEKVKANLVAEALALYPVDARIAERHFKPGLIAAMKGKRTIESLRKALEIERMTRCKILADSRAIIERFIKAHGMTLVPDEDVLELNNPDVVEAELRRRFEAAKAEAERKRLAEEAANAKREMERLKAEQAEANRPPAPPAPAQAPAEPKPDAGFVAPSLAQAEREEWDAYRASVIEAFKPLKAMRAGLKYGKNQARAAGLAAAMNKAWEDWS
jgi:hypothetical protein